MADHRAVPEWWAASAQVVVDDLDAPALGPDDLHHLGRVLRLRSGATVCATDGAGGWRFTTFTGSDLLEPETETRREAAPAYPVTVGFALVKGDKPELVVQKLTELGVDRVVVVAARRSVVRWDAERTVRNVGRMQRVAREACGQCRRLWLPEVAAADLDELTGADVVAAEAGGVPLGASHRTVLVGPEGGWDDSEIGDRGTVSLGTNVLRAETAAITAGALLTALRSGLVAPAG